MKKIREPSARSSHLFDPSRQLENLNHAAENRFQKAVQFLASCLPYSLILFILLTVLEGATSILAHQTGRAWLHQIGRTPSAIGGQGNLGLESILGMLQARFSEAKTQVVFVGDSVFAPGFGGGTVNELELSQIAASQVPQSLNLAQEGGEWGMNSLLLQKLVQQPEIIQNKPLLVLDVNFKFYGTSHSFTPAFPIEMGLCSNLPNPEDSDARSICESLKLDWPKALGAISQWSSFLYRGLQGQLDFLMSYVQRAPAYEYNVRGRGRQNLRTFLPGLLDASLFEDYLKEHPYDPWYTYYSTEQMNRYLGFIRNGYFESTSPKHLWLKSLAKSAAAWPGPVVVVWVEPSPNAQAVLGPERKADLEVMTNAVTSLFNSQGKKDLQLIPSHLILNDPHDYADSDHFSAQGHRKFAAYVRELAK